MHLGEFLARQFYVGLAALCVSGAAFAQTGDEQDQAEFPPLLVSVDEMEIDEALAEEGVNYLNPEVPADGYNFLLTDDGVYSERDPLELAHLIPPAKNTGSSWKIYKTEWDEADETGYQAFVTAIGRSRCNSLDDCLRNPANPYRDLASDHVYFGDCADMAYFLRGYYAWKNGLPWSFQNQMRTADGSRDDLRYSKAGNVIAGRKSVITPASGRPVHAPSLLKQIGGVVSTAMFRTHPETGAGNSFDDFYPVAIDRAHIVPGSIAYDVFGHVGLVYDVEADGRVMIIASHPDFSVTRSIYGANFMRTGPEFGGGLKAWRPIRLVGASKKPDGSYIGGRIIATANEDLPGFSLMQYFGNVPHSSGDWTLGEFHYEGRTLDYYDFVRRELASPDYKFDPVKELRHSMGSICREVKARRTAVDLAVRSGVHLKKHPGILPRNIYGTYGTWEAYSTPSRDARLKTSFLELRNAIEGLVEAHQAGDDSIAHSGDNLAGDLLHAFDEEKLKCRIQYTRMDETVVVLNMAHVMDRLFDLSFDPYHCPERRWGAKGPELATCVETPEKAAWYEAEQYLRNQVQRTYDVRMDFRLEQLRPPAEAAVERGGLGVQEPPDIHLKKFLYELIQPHSSEQGGVGKTVAKSEGN